MLVKDLTFKVINEVKCSISWCIRVRRTRIGYMRVREFRGLVRVEPVSREEALRVLRVDSGARES